jgi:hypothetical protein
LRFCCVCVSLEICFSPLVKMSGCRFCFVFFVSSHTAEAKQQEERQCALLKEYTSPKESRLLRIECRGERWAKVFLWVIPSCCMCLCVCASPPLACISRRDDKRLERKSTSSSSSSSHNKHKHRDTHSLAHTNTRGSGKKKRNGGGAAAEFFFFDSQSPSALSSTSLRRSS